MTPTVHDVAMEEYARIKDERAAMDEMGLGNDIVAVAANLERTRFVHAILSAYVAETRPAASDDSSTHGETIGRLRAARDLVASHTVDLASLDAILVATIRSLGGAA